MRILELGGRDMSWKPMRTATVTAVAAVALFVALVALAVAGGRPPTPTAVIAQAKATQCASANVGGGVKATDCRGRRGRRGRAGRHGLTGPRGFKGTNGARGATGVRGFPGAPGDQGETGDTGVKGPNGAPGTPGAPGQPGGPGANGQPGGPGGSDFYYDVPDPNGPNTGFFTSFKANTVVRTKTVAPGSYIVYGSGSVSNNDDDHTANPVCTLRKNGGIVDTAATNFDDLNSGEITQNQGADNENISLQAKVSDGAQMTLTLECSENGNSTGDDIRTSALVAIQVGAAG